MVSNDDESLVELVGRVVDDAKGVARAEVELARARALSRVRGYRTPAILFAVAAGLGLGAAIGLIVGVILSLATLVGPGLATVIAVGGSVLIAYICVRIGIAKL